jgi:hypothetical protein
MPSFVIALIIVIGGLWFIRKSARMQPAAARQFAKQLGGAGLLVVGAFLFLRGNTNAAMAAALAGLTMIGIAHPWAKDFGWGQGQKSGQTSSVVTTLLSMTLDHASGKIDGEVIAGSLKGRRLATLSMDELQRLHADCKAAPDQSQALLEAWLDRHREGWRQGWHAQAGKGSGMTAAEAYSVLGLKPGASAEEIRSAHRRLMKDFHPDKGGSDYLAIKINQAKDVLLPSQ